MPSTQLGLLIKNPSHIHTPPASLACKHSWGTAGKGQWGLSQLLSPTGPANDNKKLISVTPLFRMLQHRCQQYRIRGKDWWLEKTCRRAELSSQHQWDSILFMIPRIRQGNIAYSSCPWKCFGEHQAQSDPLSMTSIQLWGAPKQELRHQKVGLNKREWRDSAH